MLDLTKGLQARFASLGCAPHVPTKCMGYVRKLGWVSQWSTAAPTKNAGIRQTFELNEVFGCCTFRKLLLWPSLPWSPHSVLRPTISEAGRVRINKQKTKWWPLGALKPQRAGGWASGRNAAAAAAASLAWRKAVCTARARAIRLWLTSPSTLAWDQTRIFSQLLGVSLWASCSSSVKWDPRQS